MMILPELLFEVRGRRWAQFIAPPHRRGLTELGLASTGAEAAWSDACKAAPAAESPAVGCLNTFGV